MKPLYVIIDNGHGTREFTKGKNAPDKSLYEGEWAREFAKMLYNMLKENNIECKLLVTEKSDVSLRERVNRANNIYNMCKDHYEVVLVSLHINAAPPADGKWKDARGFTVWISNNAGEKSKKMGKATGQAATDLKLRGNRWVPKEQYNVKGYSIVHDTKMPAMLCENMFMDNKEDLAFLKSDDGKAKLLEIYKRVFLDMSSILEN